MDAGPSYVITFFDRVAGDLDIPEVHWGGGLPEAMDWASQRLPHLGSPARRIRFQVADQMGAILVPAAGDAETEARNLDPRSVGLAILSGNIQPQRRRSGGSLRPQESPRQASAPKARRPGLGRYNEEK